MSKVVLITGGSSGIGKAIGEFLKTKEYVVYGTSRHPEAYPSSEFPILKLDASDITTINETIDYIIKKEQRIDVLINNAGVGITGPIEEITESEIKNNFETNFFGPINIIKAVLPYMRKKQCGLIINVTSIAAYMGLPFRGVYSCSKGALKLLTEAFRMELKPFNIKMTSIAPGDFSTNIASRRYHAPVLENSPYKNTYNNTLKLMDAHVDSGSHPDIIAHMVFKIMNTPNPKVHYKAGKFLQKFSIMLKSILPSKLYEKILLNHYNI